MDETELEYLQQNSHLIHLSRDSEWLKIEVKDDSDVYNALEDYIASKITDEENDEICLQDQGSKWVMLIELTQKKLLTNVLSILKEVGVKEK